MRSTAILAGMFLCGVVFITNTSTASAEAPYQIAFDGSAGINYELDVMEAVEAQAQKSVQPEIPPVQEHMVADGETLTTIAKQYETTWQRMYAKNVQITHPDIINPSEKLIIPRADEQLAERALPVVPAPAPAATQPAAKSTGSNKAAKPAAPRVMRRGSVAGNTYAPGYCTWYAKNMRPDLPNNLGNADTWVARAAAQGIPTGSTPRVGAIGQRGMHVVYVQAVNGDGTVLVSEMNSRALYEVTSRTVPASYFQYIY